MATYKVLQDIEAEDKLVGPLTLRQCIYAAIAAVSAYVSYLLITSGAGFLAVFLLPIIGFGFFFAWPWGKEQSTEVWALAKVRFMLKPRKRIWDQSGLKDLVTVTAPKKLEDPRANRLSETEVRSRLKALATTIDSRGWATKGVPLDMYLTPTVHPTSDRLLEAQSGPKEVDEYGVADAQDMFDTDNNPLARQFDSKMAAASTAHRQQLVTQMANPQPAAAPPSTANAWFGAVPSTPPPIDNNAAVMTPVPTAAEPTAEEAAVIEELKRKHDLLYAPEPQSYSNMRTIQPPSAQTAQPPVIAAPIQPISAQVAASDGTVTSPVQNPQAAVTPQSNAAILELANNNDLDIATIAREAHHRNPAGSNEVVVKLH